MRIAVISDMHLGDASHADDFIYFPFKRIFPFRISHERLYSEINIFIDFLAFLENNYDKVIILGDFLEGLQFSYKKIYSVYEKIIDFVKSRENYILISGNHDRVFDNIYHGCSKYTIEVDEKKIIFLHGDIFDKPIYKRLRLVRIVLIVFRFIERLLPINEGSYGQSRAILGFYRSSLYEYAITNNADIAVMGHTHHSEICKKKEVILINSGRCHISVLEYAHIDTLSKIFEIRKYKKNFNN